MCDSLHTFCLHLCVPIDVTCLHAEEELSESEVDKYAGDFEQAFGKKNGIDLQNLRRKQMQSARKIHTGTVMDQRFLDVNRRLNLMDPSIQVVGKPVER